MSAGKLIVCWTKSLVTREDQHPEPNTPWTMQSIVPCIISTSTTLLHSAMPNWLIAAAFQHTKPSFISDSAKRARTVRVRSNTIDIEFSLSLSKIIKLYLYILNWVNYNISLTWIKAIWGWFPLLTMIPVRSQWGRYNLPIYIYIYILLLYYVYIYYIYIS